ncbi:magnesium transporter [Fulvivirgaceae bacterium BMA10]|uniref:Magnesium transporter MgtE n=1 Tax=Splendidivirga corallicola TaxID=3051826 RepID=A0ABT8KTX4_9BACT|nr:magnesium transporter [Fulvivirgaceae bacterium BMA10]
MDVNAQFELSKEYLEKLKNAIDGDDKDFIKTTMDGVNHADISSVLEEFNSADSKFVIDLLDVEVGANIISDLDDDTQKSFLKEFDSVEIAKFIDYLDSDDSADILNELPLKARQEVISKIENQEKTANILELLRYEEDSAGGLMAKEMIRANINWTVVQCIEEIRRQAGNVQKIYSVYVVDNKDKLLGRVSLKRIILADDNKKIADIYEDDIASVETFMDEEEVASIMRKYDLEAVPVVNVHGKLVGRITIDDIVDVITELAEQERQLMSGISEDVEEDDSLWVSARARLPWLVIGLAGGILAAKVMGFFEEAIKSVTAMAFFVPLIMATGGNVGIQSSSIIVQSLANKSVFEENTFKRLLKALLVAIINGAVLGAVVFITSYLLIDNDIRLAIVVSTSLVSVVLLASFTGTLTPLVLDKMGINPALASGPFITTANDLLGLGVYFIIFYVLY